MGAQNQATDSPPLVFSAADLAWQLRVSKRTVLRLRAAGKLPKPLKVGNSTRWLASEIRDWVAAGCPDVRT